MPRRRSCSLLLLLAACGAPPRAPEVAMTPERAPEPVVPPVAPARTAPVLIFDDASRVVASTTPRPPSTPRLSVAAELAATTLPRFVVTDEESLRAVCDLLADLTGLPLVVTPGAEAACYDAGAVFDLNLENPIGARNLLNLIVGQADGEVRWVLRHEAILFVSKEKAVGEKVVRLHDIQTLTFGRTDFSGPRIDRLRLLDDLEDDDGGGPFGAVGERVAGITPEEVMDLVLTQVAPGTWEDEGVVIDLAPGALVVVHTEEVQRLVGRFLSELGGY